MKVVIIYEIVINSPTSKFICLVNSLVIYRLAKYSLSQRHCPQVLSVALLSRGRLKLKLNELHGCMGDPRLNQTNAENINGTH